MSCHYVVTGAAPVGWTIAERLAERGKTVRIAIRPGSGPNHPLVKRIRRYVRDKDSLHGLMRGAVAAFHYNHASYYARDREAELPAAEAKVLAAGKEAAPSSCSLKACTPTVSRTG